MEMVLENLFPSRDRGHHSVDKNTDFKYPKLHAMLDYIYFEQDGRTHEFHYVETLCELLERAMIFEDSVELHATASKALISIASCLPELVASRYARQNFLAISAVEASALISDLVSSINGTQNLRYTHWMILGRDYARRSNAVSLVFLWLYVTNALIGVDIRGNVPECYQFSRRRDQDDLTQELASQGISIVYELGDSSMKQNLLMEDSEVSQAGSIGESLSGGKLSTYKELCGLANEMGQPDLIYKLMDLANYQAALNSKGGLLLDSPRYQNKLVNH
ncbi:hypothetical protein QJS04_geneDACA014744 [Acorus gramineus]|uniref:Uncharacterized protein n=1 Tax=Acorus gramineus TaxID=55184 RepID=A0AAV9BNF0_ACOGR|nr:hypothetical protein QJS04_geneDACA014744 [Acorus gramineus]